MTTEPAPQPAPRGARQHLAAIAATLSCYGIPARLTRLGGIPVLTAGQPGDSAAVSIDPGPGPQVDCTCIWTPAPGTTPQATASTIIAVLAAISRPGTARPTARGHSFIPNGRRRVPQAPPLTTRPRTRRRARARRLSPPTPGLEDP